MKKTTLRTNNLIVQICSYVAVCLIAILFGVVTYASIIQTCRIDPVNPQAEKINFDKDMLWVNISWIGLTILAALTAIRKNVRLSMVNTRFIVIIMLLVTTLISLKSIDLIRSAAQDDSMYLLVTARDAARGKYSTLKEGQDLFAKYGGHSYYRFYPYRLGYVLFAEVIYRIFGTKMPDVLLQIPNVIALDFIYVGLVKIIKKIFDRPAVTNLTAIMLGLCLQPMFMTSFTYGLLPGLAFSVWSVYFIIRYINEDKLWIAGISVLLMAISVTLEHKNMIVMAAVCIALLLHVVDKKRFLALTVAAVMILCSVGLQKLVIFSYEQRSGAKLNTQVSLKMNEYTGISETEMAPGWDNGSAAQLLRDNDMNVDKANEAAKKGIENRHNELTKANKLKEFYTQKLYSQMNEPGFESLWISQVNAHDYPEIEEKTQKRLDSLYTGGMNKLLGIWFNCYSMIIYLLFTAGMVMMMVKRKLRPDSIILPLAIFGGVLYHLIYEGKSQYLLPTFILLIPFAAYGVIEGARLLNKVCDFLFLDRRDNRSKGKISAFLSSKTTKSRR